MGGQVQVLKLGRLSRDLLSCPGLKFTALLCNDAAKWTNPCKFHSSVLHGCLKAKPGTQTAVSLPAGIRRDVPSRSVPI